MAPVRKAKHVVDNPALAFDHFQYRVLGAALGGSIEPMMWDIERDSENKPGFITAGKIMQWRTGFADRVIGHGTSGESLPDIKHAGNACADLGTVIDESTVDRVVDTFKNAVEGEQRFENPTLNPEELPDGYKDEVFLRRIKSWGDESEGLFDLIPELHDVLDAVQGPVESYYDSNVRLLNALIRETVHVPREVVKETEVYNNYWHIDPHPIDQVKVFVALSDIDEDCGPFHYLSFEDSQRLLQEYDDRDEAGVPGNLVEEKAEVKTFTGEKGSAMLCNTNVILHRAGNPSPENHRDLLTLQFSPVSREPELGWDEQAQWGAVSGTYKLPERLRW